MADDKIVRDPQTLRDLASKFGYTPGDLVCSKEKLHDKGHLISSVRCCWKPNRETPITLGRGKNLTNREVCIALEFIDMGNGRLTKVLTSESKMGWIKSVDLKKA